MSNKLVVSEYDFDAIKSNLKSFLQSQTSFQDYDFEGSSLNILLDILSYNTHYLAYLANMSTNELYLDSADIRNNIVSLAKDDWLYTIITKSANGVNRYSIKQCNRHKCYNVKRYNVLQQR